MTSPMDKLRHLAGGLLGLAASGLKIPAGYSNLSGDDAGKMAADPAVLVLDVRTQEEWDDGHLPKAVHIPMHELESRLGELPEDKSAPILVYCAVGGRSARAGQFLVQSGRTHVVNLSGGIVAWQDQGRPVVAP